MNQSSTAVASAPSTPSSCQRRDARRRAIVDRAIALQGQSSTMSAVEYLKSCGIDAHVIERILLEPARRRAGANASNS